MKGSNKIISKIIEINKEINKELWSLNFKKQCKK